MPMPEMIGLKKELQRVVQEIVELQDHRGTLKAIDRAMQALNGLKELNLKLLNPEQSVSSVTSPLPCPLSGELVMDPLAISSGQTYDGPLIQRWPKTEEVLKISKWCNDHGFELLSPVQEIDGEIVIFVDHQCLNSLLEKLNSPIADQMVAATVIRELTKKSPAARALFAEIADATSQLLRPLLTRKAGSDPRSLVTQKAGSDPRPLVVRKAVSDPDMEDLGEELSFRKLQDDLIKTAFNLSIHERNTEIMAGNPLVIPVLIEALKSRRIETRTNAAAVILSFTALDSHKRLIGKSGALKPLIELLEEGHALANRCAILKEGDELAEKYAAQAISNLCTVGENRIIAVSEGAVKVIMKKVKNNFLVDELLAILARLYTHDKAIEEMKQIDAVSCLLRIMRESKNERNTENCIGMLCTLSQHDDTILSAIKKDEDANGTISQLTQEGNSEAKRKAKAVLIDLEKLQPAV